MAGLTLKIEESFKGLEKSRKLAEATDNLFPKLMQLFETEVKKLTPVVTGNLASSIVGVHTGFLNGELSTIVKYAGFVEFGTANFAPRAMFRKGAVIFKENVPTVLPSLSLSWWT